MPGSTKIEERVAEFTERLAPPEILPEVAVTVVLPPATAMARPVPLTVATVVAEELQVT